MIEVSRSAREENARPQGRLFSCPFSAPAILYRPLAPRTGRGLMEIYDSHLIGFNVPRISSSRNASSDFFRTVCSFRVLTTSAIKTYIREPWFRFLMRPTCFVRQDSSSFVFDRGSKGIGFKENLQENIRLVARLFLEKNENTNKVWFFDEPRFI